MKCFLKYFYGNRKQCTDGYWIQKTFNFKVSMTMSLAYWKNTNAVVSLFLLQLLVVLVGVYSHIVLMRYIYVKLANLEANALHNAIKEKVLNRDEIVRIVSKRSKAQLMATFNHYKDEYGASITKV